MSTVMMSQCMHVGLEMGERQLKRMGGESGPYLDENAPGALHKICAPPLAPLLSPEENFLIPFCSMYKGSVPYHDLLILNSLIINKSKVN